MEQNYLNYSTEDFIQDENFIDWVLVQRQDEAWKHWLSNHPEMEEKVKQAKLVIENLKFDEEAPDLEAEDRMWTKIQMETPIDQKGSRIRRLRPWTVAAAVIATLFMAYFLMPRSAQHFESKTEIVKINLPDQSKVQLNAGSHLTYKSENDKRNLFLKGKAFFDVEPGKAFIVESTQGSVKVLGTEFVVEDRKGYYAVYCNEGKVRVDLSDTAYILSAGKYIEKPAEGNVKYGTVSQEEEKSWLSWVEGDFVFRNAKLSTVLEEIERQYGVEIQVHTNIDGIKGQFYFQKTTLEESLETVLWPVKLRYEDVDGKIIIKKQAKE